MTVTRRQALRRLTNRWLEEIERDPDTVQRMPLAGVLIEDNIRAVVALDLYSDFDNYNERRRGWELIRQWQAPRRHGWRQ